MKTQPEKTTTCPEHGCEATVVWGGGIDCPECQKYSDETDECDDILTEDQEF